MKKKKNIYIYNTKRQKKEIVKNFLTTVLLATQLRRFDNFYTPSPPNSKIPPKPSIHIERTSSYQQQTHARMLAARSIIPGNKPVELKRSRARPVVFSTAPDHATPVPDWVTCDVYGFP